MTALTLDGRVSLAGTSPVGSRWQRESAAGEAGEADLVGVGRWQRDLDAGDEFSNPGGDLDEGEAQSVELGVAPKRGLRRQAAQGVQEPVGGGMDQEPELIGGRLGARRSVGGEVQLVRLDRILGLAATAVEDLVEPARGAGEVGDDEAAVAAERRCLDTGDDPALLALPALGGVAQVTEAADLVGPLLGAADGYVLDEIGCAVEEDAVAGEAADAVALQPSKARRPSIRSLEETRAAGRGGP